MSRDSDHLVTIYRHLAALCRSMGDLSQIAFRLQEADQHRRELVELLKQSHASPELWDAIEKRARAALQIAALEERIEALRQECEEWEVKYHDLLEELETEKEARRGEAAA
jgi:uncharacterized protein YydD (DUF2326 family)